jgi:hypothetical protein
LVNSKVRKVDKGIIILLYLITMRDTQNDGASGMSHVCLELVRFRKYSLQESMSLDFLDWLVYIHRGAAANDAVEVFAVLAQIVTVREKNKGVLPADEFTAHG